MTKEILVFNGVKDFPCKDRAKFLAKCMTSFYNKERHELPIEWAMEYHLADRFKQETIPQFLEAHRILSERRVVEENMFDYNDLDNWAFIIPHAVLKILVAINQNVNYIFIYDDSGAWETKVFHCRRFWDDLNLSPTDKWEQEELDKYKNIGVEHALKKACWLEERYSDNIGDYIYMRRPNLQWFKDKDFDLSFKKEQHFTKYTSYGDCRDHGYIFSYKESCYETKVEEALHFFSDIKWALFEINSLLTVLNLE